MARAGGKSYTPQARHNDHFAMADRARSESEWPQSEYGEADNELARPPEPLPWSMGERARRLLAGRSGARTRATRRRHTGFPVFPHNPRIERRRAALQRSGRRRPNER